MPIPHQTRYLLEAAQKLSQELKADAVLLLTEKILDWEVVLEKLEGCRVLIAAEDPAITQKLKEHGNITTLEMGAQPLTTQERISMTLLEAVSKEHLRPGADVIVLYNGIDSVEERPEHIDSLSIIHMGEHLNRLSSRDLRQLETHVPLEVLRAVVDLATEIGREGREGQPVGALFVVGDTKRVLPLCRPINFNPFRGYSYDQRNILDKKVREQIKEMAKMDGAIIIRRDGVAEAGCMHINVPAEGITLSKGLGSRHWAAAAISKKTNAIAVVVSQSSGAVRIFQDGRIVLHIEPMARRPMIWRNLEMEHQDSDGKIPVSEPPTS
ncbi:MAG: hypothetical protein KatS3mg105_1616 [Gemmatales bacterium]|nr:MAG: hypothetical protein KatS3mg105_1616 [Gemmatales bacterium]